MLYLEVAIILDAFYLIWYHIPCYSSFDYHVGQKEFLFGVNTCGGRWWGEGGKKFSIWDFGNISFILFNIW